MLDISLISINTFFQEMKTKQRLDTPTFSYISTSSVCVCVPVLCDLLFDSRFLFTSFDEKASLFVCVRRLCRKDYISESYAQLVREGESWGLGVGSFCGSESSKVVTKLNARYLADDTFTLLRKI